MLVSLVISLDQGFNAKDIKFINYLKFIKFIRDNKLHFILNFKHCFFFHLHFSLRFFGSCCFYLFYSIDLTFFYSRLLILFQLLNIFYQWWCRQRFKCSWIIFFLWLSNWNWLNFFHLKICFRPSSDIFSISSQILFFWL